MKEYIVVGSGLIGLSLVLELANKVIENQDRITLITVDDIYQPISGVDSNKIMVLSDLSYNFFINLDINIDCNKIDTIHIMDGNARYQIHDYDLKLGGLGYCVAWPNLYLELCKKVTKIPSLTVINKKINNEAELLDLSKYAHHVFICDGGNLKITGVKFKNYNYQQEILIARGNSYNYQYNEACEIFTPDGALAVLPYQQQLICLFSLSKPLSDHVMKDFNQFQKMVKQYTKPYFNLEFNNDSLVRYPVRSRFMISNHNSKITFLGNAAYNIHPIMAQGFNLGLKNLQLLVKILAKKSVTGKLEYDKISNLNALKTETVIHYLALYGKYNNRVFDNMLSRLGMKRLFWHKFAKINWLQKSFFAFLQY